MTGRKSVLSYLKNARVFAPEPLGVVDLLVGGSKILWIGTGADKASGAQSLDLEGRMLVPGLIDGHAHVTGGGGESGFASRVPPVAIQRFSAAGISSVVGVLGTDDCTRHTRELFARTMGLREEGLNAWCHTGGYHLPPATFSGSVRDDIVFLQPVIGVGEVAISDHRSSQPSYEELLRLASEAHVAGLISGKAGIAHLHLGDGARGLELVARALRESELPPRVFNPTHVNRQKALWAEAKQLAAQGCTIDLTAFPDIPDDPGLSAVEAWEDYQASGAPAGRLTVSSDGGGCLPVFDRQGELQHMDIGDPASLLECVQALLRRGHPVEQVLPAFSSNVAALLKLQKHGRIAPGNSADLLVLDDDFALRDVMIRGQWHRRQGQTLRNGQFESQA